MYTQQLITVLNPVISYKIFQDFNRVNSDALEALRACGRRGASFGRRPEEPDFSRQMI